MTQVTRAQQYAALQKYARMINHIGRAYRWIGDDNYEDAVIEAQCAVIRGIESYDSRVSCSIDTYVGTCIKNAFRGYIRANKTGQEGFESRCIVFSEIFPDGILPDDCAADDGDAETVEGFLITDDVKNTIQNAGLSEREHAIIDMYLVGYSFAEIGRIEGISRERVRQVYGRAVEKMRGSKK